MDSERNTVGHVLAICSVGWPLFDQLYCLGFGFSLLCHTWIVCCGSFYCFHARVLDREKGPVAKYQAQFCSYAGPLLDDFRGGGILGAFPADDLPYDANQNPQLAIIDVVIWPIVVVATAADATFAAVLYDDLRGIETDAVLPPAKGVPVDGLTARNEI